KAVESGLRAAASRLPQTDIPSNVRDGARAVLDGYFKKRDSETQNAASEARAAEMIEITAACQLAGFADRAAEFLRSGQTLTQVQSALLALRADASSDRAGGEISARRNVVPDDPTLSWAKAIQRVGARNQ